MGQHVWRCNCKGVQYESSDSTECSRTGRTAGRRGARRACHATRVVRTRLPTLRRTGGDNAFEHGGLGADDAGLAGWLLLWADDGNDLRWRPTPSRLVPNSVPGPPRRLDFEGAWLICVRWPRCWNGRIDSCGGRTWQYGTTERSDGCWISGCQDPPPPFTTALGTYHCGASC